MLSVFIGQLMRVHDTPDSGKTFGHYGVKIPLAVNCSVVALLVRLLGAYRYLTGYTASTLRVHYMYEYLWKVNILGKATSGGWEA